MSLRSFMTSVSAKLTRAKKQNRSSRRPLSGNRSGKLEFNGLESRRMLAGIFLNSSGVLTIFGDAANEVGRLSVSGGQYQATMTGVEAQTFALSAVNEVVFIGDGGNDTFTNATDLPSTQYGNAGNDTLIGGGGIDNIFGDIGNDTIRGEGGNDFIFGDVGNDVIAGGDGDDEIAGGNGTNTINGNDGNDRIFGGINADTINGGAGIDNIFPTSGDNIISTGTGGVFNAGGTNDVLTNADLVVSGDGNDTVTGGGGWDVVFASGGDDILNGHANGINWLFGLGGADTIRGGNLDDLLAGGDGNDTINGLNGQDSILGDAGVDTINAGAGADYIRGGAGNDIINGEGGNDIAFYAASSSNYKIIGQRNALQVGGSSDGTDEVNTVTFLSFSNGAIDALPVTAETVTIQPIIVANSNGTNRSNFFGDADQERAIKLAIDDVFYAADVDANWLSARNWNNNFANNGSGGTRGTSTELDRIVSDAAGVNSSNSSVINMYFIQIPLGTSGSNFTQGFSYANLPGFQVGNGVTMHVPDAFLVGDLNLNPIALVAAHEIAHNLGLDHLNDSNNLMFSGSISSPNLNTAQRNIIRASGFTV